MGNQVFLMATVAAVYLGFTYSWGRQKRYSVPLVVILALVVGYVGWQAFDDPNARFESSETPSGQTGENAKKQPVGPNDLNSAITKQPSVPNDLNLANPDIPVGELIDTVVIIQLSIPTGIDHVNPGDIPTDNLINTGNLEPFLDSVSFDGRTQIQVDALTWARIWTNNIDFMTFSGSDVLSLLNQLPDPLPIEQVDALVANAVLASKN